MFAEVDWLVIGDGVIDRYSCGAHGNRRAVYSPRCRICKLYRLPGCGHPERAAPSRIRRISAPRSAFSRESMHARASSDRLARAWESCQASALTLKSAGWEAGSVESVGAEPCERACVHTDAASVSKTSISYALRAMAGSHPARAGSVEWQCGPSTDICPGLFPAY